MKTISVKVQIDDEQEKELNDLGIDYDIITRDLEEEVRHFFYNNMSIKPNVEATVK